ncbi:MAG: response regulator transcription factor [Bryobacteraceae bacterium]
MPEVAVLEWRAAGDWNPVGELLEAAPRCRVLLLLGNLTPETMFQAREAGVAGAISAHATPEELVDAVRRVQAGEFVFDHGVDWPRGTRSIRLTRRESDLICLLVQGLKNKEIAAALGLTEGTVKVYLCKLFQKVGAKDRFELALFGLRNLAGNGGGAPAQRKHDGGEARLRSLVVGPPDQDRARLPA